MVEQQHYYGAEQYDEDQPSVDNTDMYKKFGRESEVGKMLYGLYAQKQKPKVNYPALKTKPRPIEQPREVKPCPQKTVIEYPQEPLPDRKYHMIDFVPKRKAGAEILTEIDNQKRKPLGRAPGKMPQDRRALIEDLQEHM